MDHSELYEYLREITNKSLFSLSFPPFSLIPSFLFLSHSLSFPPLYLSLPLSLYFSPSLLSIFLSFYSINHLIFFYTFIVSPSVHRSPFLHVTPLSNSFSYHLISNYAPPSPPSYLSLHPLVFAEFSSSSSSSPSYYYFSFFLFFSFSSSSLPALLDTALRPLVFAPPPPAVSTVYYFPTDPIDDDDEGPTMGEKMVASCLQGIDLFCVWDCCYPWLKLQEWISLVVFDPFVELFITLCIVANTLFMALDHHDMNKDMEKFLKSGNLVSTK